MTQTLPEYELFAIRYATRGAKRSAHFIGGDPHDAPMAMDYFIWVAKSAERTFVIDIGFTEEIGKKRKRDYLRCPIKSLSLVGVDAADVKDVIITHLHYDHAGNFPLFPNAEFHIQEAEAHFTSGRYMRYDRFGDAYEPEDICDLVRLNFGKRVRFYNGDAELAPGIRVHYTGGHTAGLQFVSVHTKRGWVVVASDSSHFYENLGTERPFTRAFHVGQMLEAFDKLISVAPSLDHIVPGHDPMVMQLYPALSPELEDVVIRLDVAPRSTPTFTKISHH
ncbi:MAG: N-acyl homoserine lactonase family protein [Alphaproteobacteria bacterium]